MTLTRHQQRALSRAQREVATAPIAEREAIYTRVISAARDHAEAAQAKAEGKRARKAEQRTRPPRRPCLVVTAITDEAITYTFARRVP